MTCAYVIPVTAMFMHSMMIIIDIIIMIDSLHSLESYHYITYAIRSVSLSKTIHVLFQH